MKYIQKLFKKRHFLYAAALVTLGTAMVVSGLRPEATQAAASAKLYLSPSSGSYKVGTSFTVSVRENSGTEPVNAVQADLSYPGSKLQFVSTSLSGSAFAISAGTSGGNGSVSIALGSTTARTGDQLIAKVTFKVLAGGTSGAVSFAGSSAVLSANTNTNIVSTKTGASFSLVKPTTSTPTPTPKPTPKPAPTTSPKPSTSTHSSTTSIAPQNNPKPVTVPDNSKVQVSAPATVQTTPTPSKKVSKVEYYLNKKLVATVESAPYNYSVDTTKLRNGNYTLTSKTYYKDGTTDTKNTALVVKNPFSMTQLGLQARHYAWLIIILAIIIVDVIWTLIRRRSNRWLKQHVNTPPAGTPTPPAYHVGTM